MTVASARSPLPLRAGALAVVAAVVLALAGCAASDSPITDYRGEPRGVEAPASSAGGAPFAVWLRGGSRFAITLYGSAGCPPVATGYQVTGSNAIQMTVPLVTNRPCDSGYIPHTTVFPTPSSIDAHRDLTITAQQVRFTLAAMGR